MSEYRIVDATLSHVEDFLRHPIRQEDVNEWVLGSGGVKLPVLLRRAWEPQHDGTTIRRAVVDLSGRCLALWGASMHPMELGSGYVWLIASKEVEKHPIAFTVASRKEIAVLHDFVGPHLQAYVLERNDLHVRWLRLLGFKKEAQISLLPSAPPLWALYTRTAACA